MPTKTIKARRIGWHIKWRPHGRNSKQWYGWKWDTIFTTRKACLENYGEQEFRYMEKAGGWKIVPVYEED